MGEHGQRISRPARPRNRLGHRDHADTAALELIRAPAIAAFDGDAVRALRRDLVRVAGRRGGRAAKSLVGVGIDAGAPWKR